MKRGSRGHDQKVRRRLAALALVAMLFALGVPGSARAAYRVSGSVAVMYNSPGGTATYGAFRNVCRPEATLPDGVDASIVDVSAAPKNVNLTLTGNVVVSLSPAGGVMWEAVTSACAKVAGNDPVTKVLWGARKVIKLPATAKYLLVAGTAGIRLEWSLSQ